MNVDHLSDDGLCRLISILADKLVRRKAEAARQEFEDTLIRKQQDSSQDPFLALVAEAEYRARGNRNKYIDPELLGEPCWDLLLDLFVNHVRGKRLSVTSCTIASRVPPTTALRWIGELEQREIVRRVRDPDDARRVYVELTTDTVQRMRSILRRQTPGGTNLQMEGRSSGLMFPSRELGLSEVSS